MDIKTINKVVAFKNKYVSLVENYLELKKDESIFHKKYYTITSPNFVTGIAIDGCKLLTVQQYRYPINKNNIEFVAGIIEDDLSPEETIIKEMEEEAGLIVKNMKKLGVINPLSGLNTNAGYVFVIDKFEKTNKKLETYEQFTDLQTSWIERCEFEKMIVNNTISDAITIASYNLLKLNNF